MRRLGKRQIELLRATVRVAALVVPDKRSKRLCEMGLMREMKPGAFACITPDGLRALADAADEGAIELFNLPAPSPMAEASDE